MAILERRVLGPNHNRLLTVTPMSEGPLKPGQVLPTVAAALIETGWTIYTGPAVTDRGWIVPGSDERLRPRALKRS